MAVILTRLIVKRAIQFNFIDRMIYFNIVKILIRIVKEITKEEYERVKFIYNLYKYQIISEKETEEIITFFAKKHAKEREKRKHE